MEPKAKIFDLSNRLYIILVLLISGMIIYFGWQIIYQFQTMNFQNYNQITVSGQGKISTAPDIATITLGIETEGEDVKEITKENTDSMNAMIDGVKKLGVESKDIQTTQYLISPQYNWTEKEGRVLDGYKITQNIEIKIRDFTKIGDILNIGTKSGANVVNNLQFSIEDMEKVRSKAREKALTEAKEKAETIAKQTGIKLGKIINVYDESIYGDSARYSSVKMIAEDAAYGAGAVQSPTIEAGEQDLTVTVNIIYKIK